jgi:hypothetical protein
MLRMGSTIVTRGLLIALEDLTSSKIGEDSEQSQANGSFVIHSIILEITTSHAKIEHV